MEEKEKYKITVPGYLGYKTYEMVKFLTRQNVQVRRNQLEKKTRKATVVLVETDTSYDFNSSIDILAELELIECKDSIYLLEDFVSAYANDDSPKVTALKKKARETISHLQLESNDSGMIINEIMETDMSEIKYEGGEENYEFDNRNGEETIQTVRIQNEIVQNLTIDDTTKKLNGLEAKIKVPIIEMNAKLENAIQNKYSYNFGEKISREHTLEVKIPKDRHIRIVIEWKVVYQNGYIDFIWNNKNIRKSFKIVRNLTYAQKQERIGA